MTSKKLRKKLSALSLIDVSIEEEDEPCEVHSIYNCAYCDNIFYSQKNNKMLKRSISYNAIAGSNALKTKASIESFHHPLTRSYSQTSICSAATNRSDTPLQDDSFNEFMKALFKKDDYNKIKNKWDDFSPEVKKVFIAKSIANNKPEFLDPKIATKEKWLQKNSSSVNEFFEELTRSPLNTPALTPTNNAYFHYKEKLGPRFKDIFPNADGTKITKAVSISYNELPQTVKEELKVEARKKYYDEMRHRFSTVSDFTANYKDLLESDYNGLVNEKIDLDNLADMISKKIQLKLETQDKAVTPTKIEHRDTGVAEMKSLKVKTSNPKISNPKSKSSTIGKFFKVFSRKKNLSKKKKPAALNLYRSPNDIPIKKDIPIDPFFIPGKNKNAFKLETSHH